jgi:5-methylcytosine-specific restriction endonuclease McrA
MQYSRQDLHAIYDRTSGYCHICGKKLALSNYARFGDKGAWEVEHSNARVRGGTDRLNNLYPACISCNRSKGTVTTRTARAREDRKRAPLSREKRAAARRENAILGGGLGFLGAAALAGTGWGLVAAAVGAYAGYKRNPDK